MQLNPSEISELIKSRIQNLDAGAQMRTQGTVVSVTDGICRIHGLSDAMQGEMLEFPKNTFGLALNLERDSVGSVILGEYEHITEGDPVKTTGKILSVPVGPELLGRVVNSLGQPIDGKGPINAKMTDVIEKVAPGVIARQGVAQPVQTGLKAIDAMVPIGRGQRELIIGDRQTGKTAVAVDTIINQKVLFGNSSISPCITSDRPWMRQMPSVTDTTVPCVRICAPASMFWIRFLMSSEISEGLSCITAP
jgi:F-type H+-transporting ATPase subunit alpha